MRGSKTPFWDGRRSRVHRVALRYYQCSTALWSTKLEICQKRKWYVVPGQTPLSPEVPGQNYFFKGNQQESSKTGNYRKKIVIVPSHPAFRPRFFQKTSDCPVLCPVPSRPMARFWACPDVLCPGTMKKLLSLCPVKLHCPVPLETLIQIHKHVHPFAYLPGVLHRSPVFWLFFHEKAYFGWCAVVLTHASSARAS